MVYRSYRRRGIPRRSVRRRRRFKKNAGRVAWQAYRGLRHLRRMINSEKKFLDAATSATSVTDTGEITQLTNIAQGTTAITRVGNSIKILSYQFRYQIRINSSATKTLVRCLLVQDRQVNGAIFTLANLLQDATVNDSIVSPLNLNNGKRFIILYDKVHSMSINGNTAVVYRQVFKKFNLHIKYDANAGDITDIANDGLAFVIISNEPTNAPVSTLFVRLRYVDN